MNAPPILDRLRLSAEFERCVAALSDQSTPAWIEGLAGSAKIYLVAALAQRVGAPILWVTAGEEAAERAASDLSAFGILPDEIGLYPEGEPDFDTQLPAGTVLASSGAPERRALARTRIAVLEGLGSGTLRVVVAPVGAALLETLGTLAEHRLLLTQSESVSLHEVSRRLVDLGYERAPMVETPGQFSVRGGILDLWTSTQPAPVRVELFDTEIETLREFDPVSQRSLRDLPQLSVLPATEQLPAGATGKHRACTLLDHLPSSAVIVLDEPNHLRTTWIDHLEHTGERKSTGEAAASDGKSESKARTIDLEAFLEQAEAFRLVLLTLLAQSLPWMRRVQERSERLALNSGVLDPLHGNVAELSQRVRTWVGAGNQVCVFSDQPHRVAELLNEQQIPAALELAPAPGSAARAPTSEDSKVVRVVQARLSAGFRVPGIRLVLLSDFELFGDGAARRRPRATQADRKFREGRAIMSLLELREGDLVVHVSHGIGRYRGLVRRAVNGIDREFLRIDYQEPDRLFVPSDQLDRVQKYIGSADSPPAVHRLGSAEWQRTKARVRGKVREMAEELLKLYAARQAAEGHAFPQDNVWQEDLEAAFPYRETRDQLQAIRDAKRDMEAARPMDRLVCGDVGYGKTEVAIRAAFKAVTSGKQVAVLVPTTILAQQHYNTFTVRLAAFPVRVELLSRFRSRAQIKEALVGLRDGVVDLVIGTHRMLSKDVEFSDLGLLIVDEEQRFGVAHKERIKQLRAAVDVLTLTATPIPRTLHMSLSGIRDMSVVEEPPEGRLSVRTYCLEADDLVVREAILRELDRGGQVYFVHNRIDTIYGVADRVQRLVPQARIRIGHGQMKETELEDAMLSFYEGEYDVLLSTTIIESGLDVPNANTIVIQDADHLGLAQLHQLRGRVGRSSRQAYCYLLYKPFKQLTETAEKRLAAVREFTELGAGFNIAMRDMEIRGAGNLLGAEQHGNLASVGFDLYCQMIEEEVKALQGQAVVEVFLPGVILPVSAFLPHEYIQTEGLRIAFYKKIAACRTLEQVGRVQDELDDRFGDPPQPVWNLLAIMRLRIEAIPAGVARIETDKGSVVVWLARKLSREEIRSLYRENKRAQYFEDRIVLFSDSPNPLRMVETMVGLLARGGGKAAAAAVQRQLAAANATEALATARGS